MPTQTPTSKPHLPSVDRLLNEPATAPLLASHGRAAVTDAVRVTLEGHRQRLRQSGDTPPAIAELLDDLSNHLTAASRPSLVAVFNLTGTVLHTNLGRAFLPEDAIAAIADVARGASNLEYDLATGRRGDRDAHVEEQICRITGAEAATVVNNNAAAVMLVLNTLALGKEVPVSRGELVEIGGSFRIPDIMARSGCRLVEVGTTNRTHLKDFQCAIGPETALVMKVHTSNYVIQGFTVEVPERELAALCREEGVPFVNDLGSGTLANLERYGLPHEPTPQDALADGADLVTFSGDKLLGGPQAGLIVGRANLIAKVKANPLKRALRCDKMTIAALSSVLRLYADPDRLHERLPVLAALTRPLDDIRKLAERLTNAIQAALGPAFTVTASRCESEIGSGALPTRTIPSWGVAIKAAVEMAGTRGSTPDKLARAFRALPKPVVGRIHEGAFVLDLRCLTDEAAFIAQLPKLDVTP